MQSARNLRARRPRAPLFDELFALLFAVPLATSILAGCGMPGAPQPPSLNLPIPVNDLSAVRTGGEVALTWTMPTKTTAKV